MQRHLIILAGRCRCMRSRRRRWRSRRRTAPIRSWSTRRSRRAGRRSAPDWQARLDQDETQKACSQYRNAPPKDVADAIVAREKAAIVYPARRQADGRLEEGREAGRRAATAAGSPTIRRASANGGNCYACHQLAKAQVSYGTLGPSLLEYGKIRKYRRGRRQGRLRAHLQSACGHCVRKHATIGCQQVPDHRSDQGLGGLRHVARQPGEQVG